MPPARQRASSKRRIAIVVAGLVAGFTAIGVTLALAGVKFDGGYSDAKYALTQPRTVVDGRYTFSADFSDTDGPKIEEEANTDWEVRDVKAVVSRYTLGGDQAKGVLTVSGVYGRFKTPDLLCRRLMTPVTDADKESVAEPPQDFTPAGSNTTVTCEVISLAKAATTMLYPPCAWADDNTAACVGGYTAATTNQDPSDIDLEPPKPCSRSVPKHGKRSSDRPLNQSRHQGVSFRSSDRWSGVPLRDAQLRGLSRCYRTGRLSRASDGVITVR
ncbi:hypothetical protein [Streptomyces sp. NPDC001410]|uniref:hypothetical protein n=1 Tax=Streptomyces sp. NPDC001410 TaxID=3364574 RepID=UPI0036BEB1EC